MPAALPYLAAVSTALTVADQIGQMTNRPKQPTPPPTLTWEQASEQASQALDPLYDRHLRDTLQNVDQSSMARGFFGQMPAAALRGARAADVQGSRVSQIGQLANQMVGQSQQQALQQQALAQQWAQSHMGQRQAANMGLLNAGNAAMNTWASLANVTGVIPGSGTPTFQTQQQLDAMGLANAASRGQMPSTQMTTPVVQPLPGSASTLTNQYWLNPY